LEEQGTFRAHQGTNWTDQGIAAKRGKTTPRLEARIVPDAGDNFEQLGPQSDSKEKRLFCNQCKCETRHKCHAEVKRHFAREEGPKRSSFSIVYEFTQDVTTGHWNEDTGLKAEWIVTAMISMCMSTFPRERRKS